MYSGDVSPVNVESRRHNGSSVSETLRYSSAKEDSDVHLTNGSPVCSATGEQKPTKWTLNIFNSGFIQFLKLWNILHFEFDKKNVK